ncbi:MAG: hypothetical protein WC793_02810 [Candidatus Paceibacterota bacterium]|jgi:hypothetical protein
MEKIDEQLNNLSLAEVPFGIHQSVMRKVNYHKIKPVLFVSFILLLINFLIIAWRINAKLIDAEFIDMAQDFFEIFKFNFSFITTISGSFFDIISPAIFTSAILSLIGAIYVGKKINTYQFSKI